MQWIWRAVGERFPSLLPGEIYSIWFGICTVSEIRCVTSDISSRGFDPHPSPSRSSALGYKRNKNSNQHESVLNKLCRLHLGTQSEWHQTLESVWCLEKRTTESHRRTWADFEGLEVDDYRKKKSFFIKAVDRETTAESVPEWLGDGKVILVMQSNWRWNRIKCFRSIWHICR